MKIRKLTEADVTFTVECLLEDTPIKGNALASGDDAVDREEEERIRAELDAGNEWAWCTVRVTARWKHFTGVAYIGCCSYASEEDFTGANSDYFADMKSEALDELNERIASVAASLPIESEG